MTDVSEQLRLKLPKGMQTVDHEAVIRQPSMTKAIVLCADLAGFVNDKDLCRALDMDPPVWARIKAGQASFPHDKLETLFDEAGNEVPLLWLLYRRGYDLHSLRKRESETERELRMERERRAEVEKENAILRSVISGKA
jgi:hypothetical protein